MERCPKCECHTVEYDNYQQRRVCTSGKCDWQGMTFIERHRKKLLRELADERERLEEE